MSKGIVLKNERDRVVSEKLCESCKSLCCHDLVIEISAPKTDAELETLKWYLHFKHSFIFIYENTWYHMISSQCRYLDSKSNLCTNYENRAARCKEHTPPKCERYEKWYDTLFESVLALEKYVHKHKLIKNKTKSKKV